MDEKKFGKKDSFILLAVLLAVAILYVVLQVTAAAGETVLVTVDGAEYARMPLEQNATLDIMIDGEVRNTVETKDGRAYMVFADCPDKLCVHQGKIRRRGENIVCLPHRVVVSIIGGDTDEIDTITG